MSLKMTLLTIIFTYVFEFMKMTMFVASSLFLLRVFKVCERLNPSGVFCFIYLSFRNFRIYFSAQVTDITLV